MATDTAGGVGNAIPTTKTVVVRARKVPKLRQRESDGGGIDLRQPRQASPHFFCLVFPRGERAAGGLNLAGAVHGQAPFASSFADQTGIWKASKSNPRTRL